MATIVVAEDDAHISRVVCMWLAQKGHRVLEAHNGARALEILRGQAIDILISDVNMPVMNGIDLVITACRERLVGTGVILLSSRADQAGIRQALAGQKVTLRPKPFSPSGLARDVERMLVEDSMAAG